MLRICLKERKMGAVELESFPGPRQTNNNYVCDLGIVLLLSGCGVSVPCHVQLSFKFNLCV